MDPVRYEDYRPAERPAYQAEFWEEVVAQVAQRTGASVEREAVGRAVRYRPRKDVRPPQGHGHGR